MTTNATSMANPKHDERGRFASKAAPQDYLDAIGEQGGMASTTEIAETVGVKYRTAHHNLTNLREGGSVTVREVGGSYLWINEDDDE